MHFYEDHPTNSHKSLPTVVENDIILQSKKRPSMEKDFEVAYSILQTGSGGTGDNL